MTQAKTHAAPNFDRLPTHHWSGKLDGLIADSVERLARLTTRALHLPVAFIALAGIEQPVIAYARNLTDPQAARGVLTLAQIFADHIMESHAFLAIYDAHVYPLFHAQPAVRASSLVSLMGVPLRLFGQVVGAVCGSDDRTHIWTRAELDLLVDLGGMLTTEIELRVMLESYEHTRRSAHET